MDTHPSSSKKILVTGGTGFIGSQLCEQLIQNAYEVWVLTRDRQRGLRCLPSSVKVIERLDEVAGIDLFALINLAGEPLGARRWNDARKLAFRQSRIEFTNRLYEFFAEQKKFPEVVINASAIGFYGNRGDELLTELAQVGNGFAADLCKDWETAARQFESHAVRLCVIRIGIVLAANGGALKQMLPAFKLGLGGRMGSGEQYMSWIHRDDLIRLFIFLLDTPSASGIFNGVSPKPLTNSQFTKILAKSLGRPALLPMPARVLELLFGEMAKALLLSSQRVMPERAIQLGFHYEYADLNSALTKIVKK